MELPDEAITYDYQGLLIPQGGDWSPSAELRAHYFLSPAHIRDLSPRLVQVRSQVAAERDLSQTGADQAPLQPGFIDLPQKTLDQYRRQKDTSELGRILSAANRLRDRVDRVVVLGTGGSYLGAQALFKALRSSHHNELYSETRLGVPRVSFAGNSLDNDALQDLLEMLQNTCVDPERREERWGVVTISPTGEALETAAAYRVLRREAVEYYGSRSERLRQLFFAVTGPASKLRELCLAEGYAEENLLTIPPNVDERHSAFSAAGLMPAAVLGLDVRALLLGAAAMTKRFLEEPVERNPVLQFAGVSFLMTEKCGKHVRVLQTWSRKLAALGYWYDQLLSESLGKLGRGPTPLTTGDFSLRAQQLQDGMRDKLVHNLVIQAPRQVPIPIGMAEHNQDDLNALNRKGIPDLVQAAQRSANDSYFDAARPTANLLVPTLSEHTMGQLIQMLMLATVVEGRLMGINPYGQPGRDGQWRRIMASLRSSSATTNRLPGE